MRKDNLKRSLTGLILVILALSIMLLMVKCGLEETITDKFSRSYSTYLKDCAVCHAPGTSTFQDVDLDMSTESAAKASLKSAANIPGKPDCTGQRYVIAGDVAGSMLIAILDENTRSAYVAATGCTPTRLSEMPNAVPSAATLQDIKDWITEGAQ